MFTSPTDIIMTQWLAQSTLILLAIGSATGYSFGEIGIAVMILIATILVHGLAFTSKIRKLSSTWNRVHQLMDRDACIDRRFQFGLIKNSSIH